MVYDFVLFRSLTHAQRAAAALERAGLVCYIARIPQTLSAEGCGYGLKIPQRRLSQAVQLLREVGLPPGRVYRTGPDGSLREVEV
ncbi:MAG: DUF3343 domain-containing protein [Oscillospiraceae bacterium]|nr:DUF3343 domain-containing protein [Oscillospiraceae bacterium]